MSITWNAKQQRWETSMLGKLAEEAGFSRSRVLWYTTRPKVAKKVYRWMTAEAKLALDVALDNMAEEIQNSAAADASISIPCPAGQEYKGYQKACVAYCAPRSGVLIADEMGLGKTIEAIACVNADPLVSTVLIVVKAHLRLNWYNEWRKWNTSGIMPSIAYEVFPVRVDRRAVIISYNMLKKFYARIMAVDWDLLICDEAHALINLEAARTRYIVGVKQGENKSKPIPAKKRLFLTGSPLVNKPADLYPMLSVLDPMGLGRSKADFYKTYVWTTDNLAELNSMLRARCMIRRLKADVLGELPPKRHQIVFVEAKDQADLLAQERRTIAEVRAQLSATQADTAGLANAAIKLKQAHTIALTKIAEARYNTAKAKLPEVIENISAILEETDKLCVFAHHHDIIDAIYRKFFNRAVVVDGRTDTTTSTQRVAKFQNDPHTNLFIGSIRKMEGWTLTAASVCCFAELDWTPTALNQSIDRLHRIGQRSSVLAYYFVVDGSIDSKMIQVNVVKQGLADSVLDGKELNIADQMSSILEGILNNS